MPKSISTASLAANYRRMIAESEARLQRSYELLRETAKLVNGAEIPNSAKRSERSLTRIDKDSDEPAKERGQVHESAGGTISSPDC